MSLPYKLLVLTGLWWPIGLLAQVTFNGTGNLPIPPGAPAQTVGVTQSPCTVSGIGVIGGCVSIANVQINLQHTWVGDIGILLIGPGGQVLELSTGNGGSGDNYTNTVFTDNTGAFITAGAPPYTGTFRPEGRVTNLNNPYSNAPPLGTFTFANTFNGTNADGDWILYVNDYVSLDIGVITSWSITFNTGGTPPVANAGPDINICAGASAALTATGGGTYEWSTGATTATTTVTPAVTTTYTVTVSSAGCGTDTDEVVVNVTPASVFIIASPNTAICPGGSTTLTAVTTLSNYNWSGGQISPDITVNSPGTYSVTVSNAAGCTASAQIAITLQPAPTVSLSVAAPDVCAGDCLFVNANFTGTAPFALSGNLLLNGVPLPGFTQIFPSNSGSFFLCIPPGSPPGSAVVQATALTDAFCICN